MSLDPFAENECFRTSLKHTAFIEFVLDGTTRHGFQASQLLHYRLERDAAETAAMTLTIAFATADVILTGTRLDRVADHLRDGDLLVARALPERYASLAANRCYIGRIRVRPVEKP